MTIFSDNQLAIVLAQDYEFHVYIKYINICYHFIHWTIKEEKIQLVYYPTNNIVTNIFIKTLLLNLDSTVLREILELQSLIIEPLT